MGRFRFRLRLGLGRRRNPPLVPRCLLMLGPCVSRHCGFRRISVNGPLRPGLRSSGSSLRLLLMLVRMRLTVVVLMAMLGLMMVGRGLLVVVAGGDRVVTVGLANGDGVETPGLVFPLDEVLD